MVNTDRLPPSCPEAERGVLGCCLLNAGKTALALKAGVSSRWFYDLRHIEIFNVLAAMACNGGGDSLVATLKLRELGKLDQIGGLPYLSELQDAVPSAENLEFYLPNLRAYFQRRQVIDIGTRLRLLAEDPRTDPAILFTDAGNQLQHLQAQGEAADLPEIVHANDTVANTTGAAVVLAGHFAKGNASAKETIDRISGSGVFARDPDNLVVFTKHEEERAFVVEMVLRNLPPVEPFVVKWQYPLFVREASLDPARLKKVTGRRPKHTPEVLLGCLDNQRLTTTEWKDIAKAERGVCSSRFFELMSELEDAGKVAKSMTDDKWQQIRENSGNWYDEKDQ